MKIKLKIFVLLILFSLSAGEIKMLDVSIVSGPQGGVATLQNKEIRKDEEYLLYLLIVVKEGKDTLYFTEAPKLSLKGKKIEKSRMRKWDKERFGRLEIKWYKIEYNGDVYRNGSHNSGWWAKLEYIEIPVEKWRNKWSFSPDVRPTILRGARDNLGTMRFKVEIIYNGVSYSSPGIESVDKRGIMDEVHRISIREDDSYVGWLKAFFNLPYIWGSASINGEEPPECHQADRFIGSDCSDFIVAAWRKKSGMDIPYLGSYAFNEGGFYRRFVREVIKRAYKMDSVYVDSRGEVITVGKDGIKPGDIIHFNGHIGVFSKDKESIGILDISDLHIHTCFGEPEEIPLGEAFAPNFTVLRWIER